MDGQNGDALEPSELRRSLASRRLRVLLVDDDAVFRRGLRDLLDGNGIEVTADVWSGDSAALRSLEIWPDVVLLGLRPDGAGLETVKRIRTLSDGVPVVVLAASRDPAGVLDAIAAEISGFVVKDATTAEIVRALQCAVSGEIYLSPKIVPGLLVRVRGLVNSAHELTAPDSLSDREKQVLRLMAEGMENADIAYELAISVRTVKAHVSSILEKLGVENRVQAAILAVRAHDQTPSLPPVPASWAGADRRRARQTQTGGPTHTPRLPVT
jgi:DNA-binding NarL/FixJ family response regulator